MAKDLPSAVETEMDAAAHRPRVLAEIYLTGLTLRFARSASDIVFPHGGSVTYTAKDFSIDKVEQSFEGMVGRFTVDFDNVACDMGAYLENYNFAGKVFALKRIYLDSDGNAPADSDHHVLVTQGLIEIPNTPFNERFPINVVTGSPIVKKSLLDIMGPDCNRAFGDTICNRDGYADLSTLTYSGTADSGTTTTLVCSTLTGGVDEYWKYGKIIVTKSGVPFTTYVDSYDNTAKELTLEVAAPFTIDNTTTFQVWKGCDFTWDTCCCNNAWGPSADNGINFGGFIHIGAGMRGAPYSGFQWPGANF